MNAQPSHSGNKCGTIDRGRPGCTGDIPTVGIHEIVDVFFFNILPCSAAKIQRISLYGLFVHDTGPLGRVLFITASTALANARHISRKIDSRD